MVSTTTCTGKTRTSRLLSIASCALALGGITLAATAQVVPWRTQIEPSADAHTLAYDRGADGLAQTLKKLDTWASVMMIVAHPDDEDGGMLTLLSRGEGARTAILTLTRGEGGQNAMSSESYDALGLIRTNELLLADQYSGSEQYFTRFIDYGFSKTIDEAHRQWGHDRVLYDAVRAVRMYRPLVVTSVFTGNITDGHGHHQVSGEMAQEVFKAAGDPNVFPDQIAAGLRPWSPLKVYARVPTFSIGPKGIFDYATGQWAPVHFYNYVDKQWSDTVPSTDVEVPEGTWDPVLGKSFFQIARDGWSEQKSQFGGGVLALPGPVDVAYHRYGSLVPVSATPPEKERWFFDGIDTSLPGMALLVHGGDTAFLVAGLKRIHQHVAGAYFNYLPANPAKIAPELAAGYKETQQLLSQINSSPLSLDDKANLSHELNIKLAQFNTALAEALGLEVHAIVIPRTASGSNPELPMVPAETPSLVTPGAQIDVRLHVTAAEPWGAGQDLRLTRTWLDNPNGDRWPVQRLGAPGLDTPAPLAGDIVFRVDVPHDAQLTRPYFDRPNTEQPYYDIHDPRLLNQPLPPYPLAGWAEFTYQDVPVRLGQVVQTVHREHGLGQVSWPLAVAPQLSVNLPLAAGIVPLGTQAFPLTVTLKNPQQDNAAGSLALQLPQGWTSNPPSSDFQLSANAAQDFTFSITAPSLAAQSYPVKAIARSGNYEFSDGFETVGYSGLRPYYLYRPATYTARGVDVRVAPNLKIGYIMGTGDDVPQALAELGIQPQLLSPSDLASVNLAQFDTILIGIRAYSNRPDLAAWNHRLLDYVRNGGTLIVQYQSQEYDHNYGPYSLTLGRSPEKVVDETAAVNLLDPSNPLFTFPNHLTSADFNNWLEERGHSFLQSWDPRYAALTETHDPGQDPQRGGLVLAHYGKGTYIYMAFAMYRQLPEAVPGSFRLLANLASAGKNPGLKQ